MLKLLMVLRNLFLDLKFVFHKSLLSEWAFGLFYFANILGRVVQTGLIPTKIKWLPGWVTVVERKPKSNQFDQSLLLFVAVLCDMRVSLQSSTRFWLDFNQIWQDITKSGEICSPCHFAVSNRHPLRPELSESPFLQGQWWVLFFPPRNGWVESRMSTNPTRGQL